MILQAGQWTAIGAGTVLATAMPHRF